MSFFNLLWRWLQTTPGVHAQLRSQREAPTAKSTSIPHRWTPTHDSDSVVKPLSGQAYITVLYVNEHTLSYGYTLSYCKHKMELTKLFVK